LIFLCWFTPFHSAILRNSFATLLEILDPQRFTRGIDVDAKELEPVMVRRLKRRLAPPWASVFEAARRTNTCQRGELELASCSQTFNSACFPPSQLSTERSPHTGKPCAQCGALSS
jgi:hypothetical protein